MLYVQLDTNWPDHPKIISVGIDGAGLHAVCLCLAKRLNTDGWIARPLLHRQGADDELIDRLVGARLLEVEGESVRPWGWHDRNLSQAAIDAKRAARREAARRGNHTRWGHAGEFDTCPICNPETAGESQLRSHTDRFVSDTDRFLSPESESETETATSDAIPSTAPTPAARTPEQRQQRIMEAARIAAEERMIGRDDVQHPPSWVASTARGIARDHHQELHAWLIKHPTATPLELVEHVIDAHGRMPVKTGGVRVSENGLAVPGSGRVTYFTADDL